MRRYRDQIMRSDEKTEADRQIKAEKAVGEDEERRIEHNEEAGEKIRTDEDKSRDFGKDDKEGGSEEAEGYETKFRKYLCGELEIEKSRSIESDIEKFQVLLSHLDQAMDEELYEKDEGGKGSEEAAEREAELGRRISGAIGRKFRRYMIAAVAAAVCIVPAVLAGMSPLLDRICYNPDQSVEIVNEEDESAVVVNPFVTDMSVYMELFCGDKGFVDLCLWSEGYGRHTIDVQTQIDGEITSHMLELVRNHLYRSDFNWNRSDFPDNAFTYYSGRGVSCSLGKEAAREKLEKAPELMKIRTAVSFDGLKSMEELIEFMEQYDTQYLYCPVEVEGWRYWGFTPVKRGYDYEMTYDPGEYPYLDLSQYKTEERFAPAEVYEDHVESMIRYLMDKKDFLEIFEGSMPGGKTFLNIHEYKDALAYIREHGVKSYGTVVYASRDELLRMLNDPSVEGVYMLDGKLDLTF